MAEVTGVKVNELPKKTAYDESDLLYVVSNGVDLKMEMKDLKHNVAPNVFRGATELTPGESGLVPTPTVTDSNKVLGGDGEWKELAPVATSGDFNDLENIPEMFFQVSLIPAILAFLHKKIKFSSPCGRPDTKIS